MIYPVMFRDFLKIIKVGNYVVVFAVLDDRIHFEMSAENTVYCSQKFIKDIEEEMKERADNYHGEKIDFYIRMVCGMKTYYKFYPTEEQSSEMKKIQLYKELEVTKILPGLYEKDKVLYEESDSTINALAGEKMVFSATKLG
jgi:glycosyltransferase involved in cell wall biosynthesis